MFQTKIEESRDTIPLYGSHLPFQYIATGLLEYFSHSLSPCKNLLKKVAEALNQTSQKNDFSVWFLFLLYKFV